MMKIPTQNIDTKKQLMKRIMRTNELVYASASIFALSPSEKEYAVYTHEVIRWCDFKQGEIRQIIAFDVTALGFNETGDILFFATHKNGITGLYQYDKHTQEITLVTRHREEIGEISY